MDEGTAPMAYAVKNFKSGKQLKDAFKDGEVIEVFQPGPFGSKIPSGSVVIEGPHYPAAHSFWISAEVVDGVVTEIKK